MEFPEIGYLQWAKSRPKPGINLTRSGLAGLALDELGITLENLFLDGDHGHGFLPLLESIAGRYGCRTDEVVSVPGTSMGLFMACAALLGPGGEALVEHPAYEPLIAVPRALGAGVRRFERRFEDGYRLDVQRIASLLTSQTRVVLLSDLHNPSGALADREDVFKLAELAGERGGWIIVDEVYRDFVLGRGERTSFGLAENIITVSSLTKVYGLGGLRRGWILAPRGLAGRLIGMRNYFFNEEVYLEEQISARLFPRLDEMRQKTGSLAARNKARLRRFIEAEGKLSWVEPAAGLVCFPRLHGLGGNRLEEVLRLKYDTGIVPGGFFEAPDHFRLGFGAPEAVLEAGLANISRALSHL